MSKHATTDQPSCVPDQKPPRTKKRKMRRKKYKRKDLLDDNVVPSTSTAPKKSRKIKTSRNGKKSRSSPAGKPVSPASALSSTCPSKEGDQLFKHTRQKRSKKGPKEEVAWQGRFFDIDKVLLDLDTKGWSALRQVVPSFAVIAFEEFVRSYTADVLKQMGSREVDDQGDFKELFDHNWSISPSTDDWNCDSFGVENNLGWDECFGTGKMHLVSVLRYCCDGWLIPCSPLSGCQEICRCC